MNSLITQFSRKIAFLFGIMAFLFTVNMPVHAQSLKGSDRNFKLESDVSLFANQPSPKLQQIPESYRQHPEFGLTKLQNPSFANSYELLQERTENTRLFQNMDGTFTTVASDIPMHYKDNNGWWISHQEESRDNLVLSYNSTIVDNPSIIPSCFFPTYQESSLTVTIPEGELILNTFLLWEFTAVNNGWTADQHSYASGPSGQTQVFVGTGNQGGTQVYSLNTSIASGLSTGEVEIFFYAARDWGGSGCNTTFNFLQRRYIEIIHGEFQFGDGDVMVNEYSASNRSIPDSFGNFEDWIELYNPSDNFVDLTGYYLSDNPNNPFKWQFPGGIMAPGTHLLVICSGRDEMVGDIPHTNFRLSQLKPESIVFSDPDGVLLEQYTLFTTQNGHSVGRLSSGAEEWGVFTNPSPGTFNTQASAGYAAMPEFSLSPGFYDDPQTLEITITEPDAVIRYTLNGHEPTTSSAIYTGPISITQTTVVRARVFSNNENILPGFIETATFFIDEPQTLPVFSFSGTQLLTLFGGTQIEPIGAFEYFDESGQLIDKSVGDFNKHGQDSWSYPQRGVDFVSRDEYGYNRWLTHKFFPTSEREEFQRLMVKAAANDNHPFASGGAHVRDAYIQSLSQLSNLELDERSSIFISLYVNGQYWGVYDLREKVDDNDFTDYYYGQDEIFKGSPEYVQFLKTWGVTQAKYGGPQAVQAWTALRNFVNNNNMANQANYDYVVSQLDLESMIDYFVINSVIVSRDWLNYNTGWWRGLNPSGAAQKWRYILWDQDAAFGHYTNFTGLPNPTATAPPCQVENLNVGNGHAQILKKLIDQNPEARYLYVTRYIDLMNTHLSAANMIHVLDSMVAVIEPEMPRQIARWGGNMITWQQNVQAIRDFINLRETSMVQGLIDCYQLTGPYDVLFVAVPAGTGQIKMNSEWLKEYPFTASMYGGIETRLEAAGIAPYVFSHWEVSGHTISPGTNSPAITLSLLQNATVKAHFVNPLTDKDIVHYWHFNNLPSGTLTSVPSDYSALLPASITYPGTGDGYMDRRTHRAQDPVSNLNLHMGQEPDDGAVLRVRNPSDTRELIIEAPSSGFEDIAVAFATVRTNNGAQEQEFFYSTDAGLNWHTVADVYRIEVLPDWELKTFDLSSITAANNNPDLQFRFLFHGDEAGGSSGNNRFDNFSVHGFPVITPVQFYSKPDGYLDELSTWGTEPDGNGEHPSGFDVDLATFYIHNRDETSLTKPWAVTGINSKVVIGDGMAPTHLILEETLTALVDVSANATLTIGVSDYPVFGHFENGSTIVFANDASQIPYYNYHHLAFDNIHPLFSGNGTIILNGDMTLNGEVLMPDSRGTSHQYNFIFTGAESQMIATNSNVLRSYNMNFTKSEGSIHFNANSIISTDNQLTFNIGSDALFQDNGITMYAGNSVNIAGDGESYNFTGTLILAGAVEGIVNGSGAGNNFNIREGNNTNMVAALNNLLVRVANTEGEFRFRDGTTNEFSIEGSLYVESGADGRIRFYDNDVFIGGDFIIEEGFAGTLDSIASLTFNGEILQSIELSLPLITQILVVDNSSGISFGSDATVINELILEDGILHLTDDAMIRMELDASISGYSPESYISGRLAITTNNEASSEILFPVGTQNAYLPFMFEVSHANNNQIVYIGSVRDFEPLRSGLDEELGFILEEYIYDLSFEGDAAITESVITLPFNEASLGFDPEMLRIAKYENDEWINLGGLIDGETISSTESFNLPGTFALAKVYEEPVVPPMLSLQDIIITGASDTCFAATQTLTLAGEGTIVRVEDGAIASFIAGENIIALPHTVFEPGSNVRLFIDETQTWCSQPESMLLAGASEPENKLTQDPKINAVNDHAFFRVFPNPTNRLFTLELTEVEATVVIVEIFSVVGERLTIKELKGEKSYIIDLGSNPPGLYVIKITHNQQSGITKVIKK